MKENTQVGNNLSSALVNNLEFCKVVLQDEVGRLVKKINYQGFVYSFM